VQDMVRRDQAAEERIGWRSRSLEKRSARV